MVKKIALALFCITVILSMNLFKSNLLFTGSDYYIFYSGRQYSSSKIISVSSDEAMAVKSKIKNLSGESAYYLNKNMKDEILNDFNAEIVFTETIDSINNIYAYSSEIKDYIILNNRKINLHIAVSGNNTAVGSPIIFGGY